jgi:hypothetical protein
MAEFVISVFGSTPASFVTNFNTQFAALLGNAVLDFGFVTGDKVRVSDSELIFMARINDAGVAISNPYKVQVFTSQTLANANVQAQAFIDANPTFWFGPVRAGYLEPTRRTTPYFVYVVYNESLVDGPLNWGVGGGGGGTYTNATPTPVTIGGIPAGSTFLNQTLQQMFDALLYPYQAPAFSSFSITGQSSPLEVGATIAAPVTFTWGTTNSANVQANSIDILDVTGSLTLATGLANDGSEAIVRPGATTLTAAGSYTFRIEGTNSLAAVFTRNLTFEWRWRAYWGFSANVTLSEAQIEALASNALTTAIAGSYSMGATGYKYICVANAVGGQINAVKDSLTLLNVPMATVADNAAYNNVDGGGFSYALVSVTNTNGVTTNYRVYRTQNSLGAAITLLVT